MVSRKIRAYISATCSLDVSARHYTSCGQYKYFSRVSPGSRCYVRVLGRSKMSVSVGVDVTGLQVTFSNPKVLPLLNSTIHALVSTNGNPLSSLEQAVSLDKQFLFGEILVVSKSSGPIPCMCRFRAILQLTLSPFIL